MAIAVRGQKRVTCITGKDSSRYVTRAGVELRISDALYDYFIQPDARHADAADRGATDGNLAHAPVDGQPSRLHELPRLQCFPLGTGGIPG